MNSHNPHKTLIRVDKSKIIWLFVCTFILQGIYLYFSKSTFSIGFPLDDAWIHQTYARNLALSGRWEYIPGQLSGGSTSPLWTLLLVPGHLIGDGFYLIWTFLLSFFLLFISAYFFDLTISKLVRSNQHFPLYGVLFLSEWHLIWAASSGMETILLIMLFILMMNILLLGDIFSWTFALICSLLVWVRPDAISFMGIVGIFFLSNVFRKETSLGKLWKVILLFTISLAFYGLFNYFITGSFFPNTFYAKQMEYAVLYNTSLITRLGRIFLIPITGIGILFVPPFLYQIISWWKKREFKMLSFPCWLILFYGLYAVRLPVTYQHGRYFIPTIPIFLFVGLLGIYTLKEKMDHYWGRLISLSWKMAVLALAVNFYVIGANTYAQDVAIIQSEMVEVSKWIAENTPENALVAAHDIGALGFFGNRQIIDLAGLISPEVIPFMSNEEMLSETLNQKNVDYLMTFPDWYQTLTKGKTTVYQGSHIYVIKAGGTHMSVFDWRD